MTYDNRLACTPCNKKKQGQATNTNEVKPVEPVVPVVPVVPTDNKVTAKNTGSLGTIECQDKKILSITKVGDKVIVMYDDCSYQTADKSVVAIESLVGDFLECFDDEITALKEKVTALENKQDKDTIYDDSALKERVTALENKPDKDTIYDDTAIKNDINQIKQSLQNVVTKDNLIVVENLEGTRDLFRAIPLE